MTTFGERIRRLRGEHKLTMKELGERVRLTESAIGMIERGERNPSFEKLRELSDYFEVDINFLIGLRDNSYRHHVDKQELDQAKSYLFDNIGFRSDDDLIEMSDDQSLISLANELKRTGPHTKEEINKRFGINEFNSNESNDSSYKPIKTVSIRIYQSISCGTGKNVEDNIYEYITLPESLFKQGKEYFCQFAIGDSMLNENINEGDLLVFEKTSIVENGQIGCFCIDENMATCKKFYKDDASAIITLQPANPKYAPIIVTVENMNFHVVGKLSLVINKRD